MMIVDSQVHAGLNWSEPVEALVFHMDSNGVSHAVIIQHNNNYNNSYILDCAHRYKGRFAIVGLVDARHPEKRRKLEELKAQGAAGIRLNLRRESWDPADPLYSDAGKLGMVVSVIGRAADFASAKFKTMLDRCPETQFCLEHLVLSPGEAPVKDYELALECAHWPNTTVKVPGLGEIAERPRPMPEGYPFIGVNPPEYQMAKEAFGVRRMMWGSNFPPCSHKEGYRNALIGVRDLPVFKDGDDSEWVMGKTAAKLWGFEQ